MSRRKKERGRPLERLYPPRIDATPELLVQAMFNTPPDAIFEVAGISLLGVRS